MKLSVSSSVIIASNDSTLKRNEVLQMFGRSCRAQGKGKGMIIMLNKEVNDIELAWKAIINRKVFIPSDASNNLIGLYEALPYMKEETLKLSKKIFDNNKW